jgi:hypothetical protein
MLGVASISLSFALRATPLTLRAALFTPFT